MFAAEEYNHLSHKAVYGGPESPDWINGKEYDILIQKMLDNRYAVFKSSAHYNESPGYKVFNSLEELQQQFKYENASNAVR